MLKLNKLKYISSIIGAFFMFQATSVKAQAPSYDTSDGVSHISLPNVFTPNHDSINDVFAPFIDEISSMDMYIYNRWGNLIFESHQVRSFWDGYTNSGEPCSDGIYFCVITATGNDGQKFKDKVALRLFTDGVQYK